MNSVKTVNHVKSHMSHKYLNEEESGETFTLKQQNYQHI